MEGAVFPANSTPFMYQAGIGFYAVSPQGIIYEWDTETREMSGEYCDVLTIFDEWLEATHNST